MIDLTSIAVDSFDLQVFFASNEFSVYRQGQRLLFEKGEYLNCGDALTLADILCPQDIKHFDIFEMPDAFVMLVGGRTSILLDKSGFSPIIHSFDEQRSGRIITRIFPAGENCFFAGISSLGRSQFIKYDYVEGIVRLKSQYWQTSTINGLFVDVNAYAVLNNTFVAALTLDCETLWSRFESGVVSTPLVKKGNDLVYVAGKALHFTVDGNVRPSIIPRTTPGKVASISGDVIYVISEDAKTLVAYDSSKDSVLWELSGNSPILESLPIKGKVGRDTVDAMLIRLPEYIASIDLTNGRKMAVYSITDVYQMNKSRDNVILNRRGNRSDVIRGIPDA